MKQDYANQHVRDHGNSSIPAPASQHEKRALDGKDLQVDLREKRHTTRADRIVHKQAREHYAASNIIDPSERSPSRYRFALSFPSL